MADAAAPHSKRRRTRAIVTFTAVGLVVGGTLLLVFSSTFRVRTLNALLWLDVRVRPQHIAATQQSLDRWVPAGAVIVAGDSFAVMLPEHWMDGRAIDFGLGGASTRHVHAQLRTLSSISRAHALVLLVGSNDLVHNTTAQAETDLRALLADLPAGLSVLLCTIPPVDPAVHRDRAPEAIAQLNARWALCTAARPRTTLVHVETALADPAGRLRADLHLGDGLHLNAAGNRALATHLRDMLQKIAP